MRKVHLTLEGQILVPVRVRSKLIVTLDDQASVNDAVRLFLDGRADSFANVEVDETAILAIGSAEVDGQGEFDPGEVDMERFYGVAVNRFTISNLQVDNSK